MNLLVAIALLATAAREGACIPRASWTTTEWPTVDSPPSSAPEILASAPDWCTCLDVRACAGARRLLGRGGEQQRRILVDLACGFDGFVPFVCCNLVPDAPASSAELLPRRRPGRGDRPGTGDADRTTPCPAPARGRDDPASPGAPPTSPRGHVNHAAPRHRAPDTPKLPLSLKNLFRRGPGRNGVHENEQAHYPTDSSERDFPPAYGFDEYADAEPDRGIQTLHHHFHTLVRTIPAYYPTPDNPAPTDFPRTPMTQYNFHKWDRNHMPNGFDTPKRATPSGSGRDGNTPCGNDANVVNHNRDASAEEDERAVTRNHHRGRPNMFPPVFFPTSQPRPLGEDANAIPPEYVRGGVAVPSASTTTTSPRPLPAGVNGVPEADEGATETPWQLSRSRAEKKRKLLEVEECGVSADQRIVGGKTAALGAFPWIARLGYTRGVSRQVMYRCGGSLITRQHVVTAAHCVTKLPGGLQLVSVRLGELDEGTDPDCNIAECADPVQDFNPRAVTVHGSYDRPKYKNDIAVIRLDRPARITAYVSIICLPFEEYTKPNYTGQSVIAAGWGSTSMGASSSKVLQWVKLKVLPTPSCSATFMRRANVSVGAGQICAAGDAGRDSCEGDSGGPLASMEQPTMSSLARHVLVGLVSFGARTCATDTVPGVYTHVASYLHWLLDHIPAREL